MSCQQHVVCNIESDSVQQSSSIRLGVPGVIEERRDYDGHDLLSDDEKGWIERFLSTPITYETMLTTTKGTEVGGNHIHDILFDGSMTEGYVIDAYFDILDERILNEDVKNYWRCLFMKHFVQVTVFVYIYNIIHYNILYVIYKYVSFTVSVNMSFQRLTMQKEEKDRLGFTSRFMPKCKDDIISEADRYIFVLNNDLH